MTTILSNRDGQARGFTDSASLASVLLEALGPGGGSPCFELPRNVVARAEVHLVGRLPAERGVGHTLVVLGHLECDEAFDGGDRVKCIEE